MKLIPLTQGKFAMVDDSDFERLSVFKWYAKKDRDNFYARRDITVSPYKQKSLFMHREVVGVSGLVDHRDGNGLNNQRYNLRPATAIQNRQNRRKLAPASSRFKGVLWHTRDGGWHSGIRVGGFRKHLGCFQSETDAAHAYDEAALTYFGEFANLNFPKK